MASMDISGIDELVEKLEHLADQSRVEEIAKHAVAAAQPISEASMRSAIASVENGPYATGSVSGSVSSTEVKVNSFGVYAVARPTGRDSRGTRNAEKAAILQYGAPHMAARPWRERAVNAAQEQCMQTVEQVIREEMELE